MEAGQPILLCSHPLHQRSLPFDLVDFMRVPASVKCQESAHAGVRRCSSALVHAWQRLLPTCSAVMRSVRLGNGRYTDAQGAAADIGGGKPQGGRDPRAWSCPSTDVPPFWLLCSSPLHPVLPNRNCGRLELRGGGAGLGIPAS